MRTRRAGEPAAPTPLRARRAVDVSTRSARSPDRCAKIRGLPELALAYRQTEPSWREVWVEELGRR